MNLKITLTAFLLSPIFFAYSQTVDLSNGLIQYFPLDNNIDDMSVNGFKGQVIGNVTPAKGYQGLDNTSYDFTQGSIKIKDTLKVPFPFTVSYWLYQTTDEWATTYRTISSYPQSFELGIAGFQNNFIPRCSLYVSNEFDIRYEEFKNYSILPNKWSNVLYEIRKDSILLFVNGGFISKIFFNSYKQTAAAIEFNGAELGSRFKGKIDEFRIYNRILNVKEKKTLADPNTVITANEESNSFFNRVSIYPNPSNGKINIDINQIGESKITILNAIGNKIYEETFNYQNTKTTQTIDISNFEKGIFFVQVSTLNKLILDKIVVE